MYFKIENNVIIVYFPDLWGPIQIKVGLLVILLVDTAYMCYVNFARFFFIDIYKSDS